MGGAYPLRQCAVMDKEEEKHMDRVEEARRTLLALYGGSHSPLEESDPDFAAIKQRLVYGELYAQEALDPVMRELILLAVSTTNQTMFEVKLHPVPHCLYRAWQGRGRCGCGQRSSADAGHLPPAGQSAHSLRGGAADGRHCRPEVHFRPAHR